jgi:hypothetical protein
VTIKDHESHKAAYATSEVTSPRLKSSYARIFEMIQHGGRAADYKRRGGSLSDLFKTTLPVAATPEDRDMPQAAGLPGG